ncbi:MAG: protein kinase [Candidatus Wallbacteria bacterium]
MFVVVAGSECFAAAGQSGNKLTAYFERKAQSGLTAGPVLCSVDNDRVLILSPQASKITASDFNTENIEWEFPVRDKVKKIIPSSDRLKMLILYEDKTFDVVDSRNGRKINVDQAPGMVLDAVAALKGFVLRQTTAVLDLNYKTMALVPVVAQEDVKDISALFDSRGNAFLAVVSAKNLKVFNSDYQIISQTAAVNARNDFEQAQKAFLYYSDAKSFGESKPELAVALKNSVAVYNCGSANAVLKKNVSISGVITDITGFYDEKNGAGILIFGTEQGYIAIDTKNYMTVWNVKAPLSKKSFPAVIFEKQSDFIKIAFNRQPDEIIVIDARTGEEFASVKYDGKALFNIEAASPKGTGQLFFLIQTTDALRCFKLSGEFNAAAFFPAASRFITNTPPVYDFKRDGLPFTTPSDLKDLKLIWSLYNYEIMIGLAVLFGLFIFKKIAGMIFKRAPKKMNNSSSDAELTGAEIENQITRLKQMLEASPENIELMLNLIALLKKSGKPEEAVELYKTLIKLRPSEDIYYEELIQMRPPFFGYINELVTLYKKKGKIKSVIGEYEERVKKMSEENEYFDVISSKILARMYYDEKRYKDAGDLFEIIIKKEPNSYDELLMLSDCLTQLEELERAIEVLNTLKNIDKSKNVVNHYCNCMRLYHRLSLHDEAVAEFAMAMESKAGAFEVLLPYVDEYFGESIKLGNKKMIIAYGNCLVEAYFKQKNIVAAVAAADKMLGLFPKERVLIRKKAFLLLEKGDETGSLALFKELYEADKFDLRVKTEYCKLLQKTNKIDECISIIIDSVKKNENPEKFLDIYINLANELIKSKNSSKVIETAPKLYEFSKSIVCLKLLAEAYLKIGDIDAALKIYARYAELTPDDKEVKKRFKYIETLAEERRINELKAGEAGNDDKSVHLIVDGENIKVKKSAGGDSEKPKLNPLEIKAAEAKLYFEKGEYKKAIPVFQEIVKLLDGKKAGLIMQIYLITCFLKERMNQAAVKVYDSINTSGLALSDKERLAFKYKVGVTFQENNELGKAEVIFSEIAADDMAYKDIGERLSVVKNALSQFAKEKAAPKPAAVQPADDDGERTTIAKVASELDYIDARFEIINQIGKGGMGIVYKARDTKEKREVAIKIPILTFKDDAGFMERFEREARLLERLKHPNIMQIFSVERGALPYIVMEVLTGRSLKEIIKDKKIIPPAEMRDIGIQCCEALSYTHKLNIVHRDIKPENIMILKETDQVKLMDFGLAKALDDSSTTKAGTILGTFAYISPEQCTGEQVDGRADIYSLGVMFYEMLVGEKPFVSGDFVHQHLKVKPVPPTKKNPKLPYTVEAIVLKCLEKNPVDRYQNTEELKAELEKIV